LSKDYIKFWGVRGSHPTPDIDKVNFGGDTSCIEVSFGNELIILDMGSGIRNLGDAMLKNKNTPKTVHIFLSHFHWDHIVGFLNFKPLFDSSFTFNIYGTNPNTDIKNITKKLLDPTLWPVSLEMLKAKINFINLDENHLKINDRLVVEHTQHSHPNGATSYKISKNNFSILYTTDCEHTNNILNKNVIKIANNADIMIHDSHFTDEDLLNHVGWGHSSWKNAVDVAKIANVKKLILFHFSPEYNDEKISKIESKAKQSFENTIASKQGLKIELI